MAGFGQARDVGVVAEGEGPFAIEHGEADGGSVGVARQQAGVEGQVVAWPLVDIPAHVAAVDQLAELSLVLETHHRQQAALRPAAPFGARVEVPLAGQPRVGDAQVADVRLVDVAHGEACLGVEGLTPLAEPGRAGAEGGVGGMGAAEALGAVGHVDALGAEARLSVAHLKTCREQVVAVANGLEVGGNGAGDGGAVAEGAGTVARYPEAAVHPVAVACATHEVELGGGGECLEGCADGGPLVAVDGPEAPCAVEEARVGRVEQQRVEVHHREVDVLPRGREEKGKRKKEK